MKLFFWTENEPECCSHYVVFADTEDEARALVVEHIKKSFEPEPDSDDPYDEAEWCAKHLKYALDAFDDRAQWQVISYEIKPGVA